MSLSGDSLAKEERVITIGVLESSLSAADKSAISQTLEALKKLPGYRLDVQYYNPSELEDQLVRRRLDYFIGTSGFLSKVSILWSKKRRNALYRSRP